MKLGDSRRAPAPVTPHGGTQFSFFRAWRELNRPIKKEIQRWSSRDTLRRVQGEQPAARVQVSRRGLRSLQHRPALLTCYLKSRLNPWVSLGRMENKGSCPGTCKVITVIILSFYGATPRRWLAGLRRCRTEVHSAHRSVTKTFQRADFSFLQIK